MSKTRHTSPSAMASKATPALVVNLPKPRNPLVAPVMQRLAGAHRRSRHGDRQQAQQALRQELACLKPPSPPSY